MAITKPVPVPETEITSTDFTGWPSGLHLNGDQNTPPTGFVDSKDVELSTDGFLMPRRVLIPFLPDTVETTYQKLPVTWNGNLYYFTADNGKVRFCQEGDSSWTDCASAEVDATLTTALTGTNNDLTFTGKPRGALGNVITVAYVNAGASQTLLVTVTGNAISVRLATNGSSVITSTASQVLAAIIASAPATALVTAVLAVGNTGAGVVTALTATNLAGGSGTNIITTNNGGKPKFLRVLDSVLILNGKNGDKLAFVDLTTPGFPVVHYTFVTDPGTVMTGALTNLTTGAFSVYYAYSYSGAVGETLLNPILTKSINIVRDQWESQTSPGSIKVSRPAGAAPAGAEFWNLYVAIAATGGVIQDSDMLRVATKLDLANFDFVDDGTLSINLSSVAPSANSTDGPKVEHGIVEDGNPILFGDQDDAENIWIGGGGQYALDFSVSNGGYLAQPEKGTNFEVNTIIGFRNGSGVPSLTVLFSNTEGLSKQSVLQQQTVNYGTQSFTVWGVTEQHYGAAGVAATDSAINYNGKLLFLSTDGFMSMNTQPLRQNVISTDSISVQAIDSYVRGIINKAMPSVIGAGWDNKYMWTVPNAGFITPQQILILDDNNKVADASAWYTLDIPANWIGVVSPRDDSAFVYISQGKSTYKLIPGSSTFDVKGGVNIPFSTSAKGPLSGMYGSAAHNVWQATVQAKFYVLGLIGDITIGVNYRNQNGKIKTKSKTYHGPSYVPSSGGSWGDTHYVYGGFPFLPRWADGPPVSGDIGVITPLDIAIPVDIDDIINEAQWFYSTPVGYSSYKLKVVSYEGINLGVRPGVQ